jgi:hypothetical protein
MSLRRAPARLLTLLLLAPLSAIAAQGQNAVTPGLARVDATFQHLAVHWTILGDDNADSTFQLEFRRQGTSPWLPAAIAMRAEPSVIVDGAPLGKNSWAASALFLESGAAYDLRLSLVDPDGGGEVRMLSGTTREPLRPATSGRQLHVTPGSGGGNGSPEDPFRGLQAAASMALPGDVFHVAPGIYQPFQIANSGIAGLPIVFLGPGDGTALVDGSDTTTGIVTVGTGSLSPIAYVVIKGLTIQNGRWGIDAQHSSDIAIRYNHIRDVDYGVLNRRGDDLERNQTVCDNVIEGRTPWPGTGIPSERGIDLRGFGNVVCHNRVRDFGDCVSVQPATGDSFANDVYGNDVSRCVDDGIEIDYNQANARVWRNRVYNARMGVSVQPIRGGPAYIFRNELFNLEDKTLKLHNSPAGLVIVHNTGVKLGNAVHDPCCSIWRNALFRNNLFLGTEYAFEFVSMATDGFRDFDFDGWGSTRAGTVAEPHFKWDNVRYADLPALRAGAGIEISGLAASFADLVNAALPISWDVEVDPTSRDLRLAGGTPEIGAGTLLSNLNDGFAISDAPDLGAFESGASLPEYGPRLALFSDGFESGHLSSWSTSSGASGP